MSTQHVNDNLLSSLAKFYAQHQSQAHEEISQKLDKLEKRIDSCPCTADSVAQLFLKYQSILKRFEKIKLTSITGCEAVQLKHILNSNSQSKEVNKYYFPIVFKKIQDLLHRLPCCPLTCIELNRLAVDRKIIVFFKHYIYGDDGYHSSPFANNFSSLNSLSEGSLKCVRYDGMVSRTAENIFQQQKFPPNTVCLLEYPDPPIYSCVSKNKSQMRSDWTLTRENVLLEIVRAKFTQNPVFKDLLLATQDAYLLQIQGYQRFGENEFKLFKSDIDAEDVFLGVLPNGAGQNFLGKCLMQVRKELGGTGEVPVPDKWREFLIGLNGK